MRNPLIALIVFILIVVSGYYTYTYLKEEPPTALIELVTKTDPPPPLPPGDAAPLVAPPGFTATIFSRDVPNARVMVRDPKGTMLVSQTKDGKVVALPDLNADGKADGVVTILEGLDLPHGLAFNCPEDGTKSAAQDACILYVAETGELKSYAYDADTYRATYKETLTTLPKGKGHFTRTLLIGPKLLMDPKSERLLISIGSSCNVCLESDNYRASVITFDRQTKVFTMLSNGLRNTVFMAVDPKTGKIWGTDNGRDLIGDDIPPDEVNILQEGSHYGWPICYGNNIHDTDFDKRKDVEDPCKNMVPPHIELQAHSAALGLGFIPDEGWPEDMRGDLLIAYHGSWNRSEPTGYKVVRFDLDENRNAVGGPIDFLTGFLGSGEKPDAAIGRPVGLLVEPGVLYVSDDRAGAIYRVAANQ